jgi:DNA polymerase III epsilon subunit-like protein
MDTETTSLLAIDAADLAQQPHMVEISCIKTDYHFDIVSMFTTLVKPPIRIPFEVINIHGITDEEVANHKPFAGHYKLLAEYFLGVTCLVGHNLQFDKHVLEYELKRINKVTNFPWPPKNICTVEEAMKIKGHRISLGNLYFELFGQNFEEAHRAEADTKALVRVYKEMVNRQMVEFKP